MDKGESEPLVRRDAGKSGIADALRETARLLQSGDNDAALAILYPALYEEPLNSGAFLFFSDLCIFSKRWDLLDEICHLRLKEMPDEAETLCRQAQARLGLGRYLEAARILEGVAAGSPLNGVAWHELGRVQKRLAMPDEALVSFKKAVESDPGNMVFQDSSLFAMLFSDTVSPEEIAVAHRSWGEKFAFPVLGRKSAVHGGKITVGYLSPDFREHSVSSFIRPVIVNHDRERFRVICYHCGPEKDRTTMQFSEMAEFWRDITDMSDADAYSLIADDNVDILVELAGHTAWNRLQLMAMRPAGINVSWIGYPHSTGLSGIDFRLTDAMADPPGLSEPLSTERLARLPGCFLCYSPPVDSPLPSFAPPMLENGFVTFGSFNNPGKITPKILGCWRALLKAVPESRLMLKGEAFDDPEACSDMLERFSLPEERVITAGWTPDRRSHLALYNHVDIALDTWPYNGTTTTCEALWMGVPVITLAGSHHASRVGATLLSAAGLGMFICKSAEEYLRKGIELSGNPGLLEWSRRNLRKMVSASPLMDGAGFTLELEKLYDSLVSGCSCR